MIIFLAISFTIIFFICVCWDICSDENSKIRILAIIISCISAILCWICIYKDIPKEPQAIDVYRGKTVMEFKGYYEGDTFIPTDTIVVWKE